MTNLNPINPQERIEILDILRGFALLGIIFNNMMYFSGYAFIPFDHLKEIVNFQLNENIYSFLDFVVRAKFYTLFSILFAVGFYLQFSKHREDSIKFLKTYRRRIFILLGIGLVHSLIWFGDILFTYSIAAFILILFRNFRNRSVLYCALFFMLLPVMLDLAILPFLQTTNAIGNDSSIAIAHVNYPDMAPAVVIDTFQNGTFTDLFTLTSRIHSLINFLNSLIFIFLYKYH